MTRPRPWVVVVLAVGTGLFLWTGLVLGTHGIESLLGLLMIATGLAGPCYAAFRLGRQALASPAFRWRLLAILVLAALLSVVAGWVGMAGTLHVAAIALMVMVVAALTVCAALATAAYRPGLPGRAGLDGVARSLWTLVLVGGISYVSLPVGWVSQGHAVDGAKAWVERAVVEVRAEVNAKGTPPRNLEGILQRIDPPPRLVPRDGGYSVSSDGTRYSFRIDDPSLFLGWWVFESETGTWRVERF